MGMFGNMEWRGVLICPDVMPRQASLRCSAVVLKALGSVPDDFAGAGTWPIARQDDQLGPLAVSDGVARRPGDRRRLRHRDEFAGDNGNGRTHKVCV
jgi:hypothetical protein